MPYTDRAGYFSPTGSTTGPLRFASGPATVQSSAASVLKLYYTGFEAPGTPPAEISAPQISRPIPSYTADLLAGGLETAVSSNTFIYTMGASGKPFVHVTIRDGKFSSAAQFMGNDVPRVLNEVVALEEVKAGTFEPRLLGFQGLWTVLWLKSVSGGPDYLYPVAETAHPEDPVARKIPSLQARTLYSVEDFLAAVRPELEAKRAVPRQYPPRRGGG